MTDNKSGLRTVIAPVLLASLLLGWTRLAARQMPGVDAQQTAQRAYQEFAAKDYQGAIQDFREALAEAPSNSQWRKDLGYADAAAGLPQEARKELEAVFRQHPEDLGVALELGYLSQQLREVNEAERYFNAAGKSLNSNIARLAQAALATLEASLLQTRKQRAYQLLVQGRRAEALKLFERVHEGDSGDATTTLQLGYLYAAAGDWAKAREMFRTERDDHDPAVSLQAKAALAEVNRQSAWWFG